MKLLHYVLQFLVTEGIHILVLVLPVRFCVQFCSLSLVDKANIEKLTMCVCFHTLLSQNFVCLKSELQLRNLQIM